MHEVPMPGKEPNLQSGDLAEGIHGRGFHELAELLPLTVFETDNHGRFTYVNGFGLNLSGYRTEDIAAGVSVFQVVQPGTGVSLEANLRAKLAGGSDTNAEYFLVTRTGEQIPVTVKASAILDNGHIVGLRGVVIDLTEQKRLEVAKARAERLEAAGQIAGQVAHDFNNLLAPLLAYPQLIREKIGSGHPATRYLDDIET